MPSTPPPFNLTTILPHQYLIIFNSYFHNTGKNPIFAPQFLDVLYIMESLNHFSIPILGLKDGVHPFKFLIDKDFFIHFEDSPIEEGNFEVNLSFDKRPDMIVLDFAFEGTVRTDCDRCLANINLPVTDEQQLIVKYGLVEKEDADVLYLVRDTSELNVAKYIYEYICLAMPMIKVYDCENENPSVCNDEVTQYLDRETDKPDSDNPIWDQLKNLKESVHLN